MFKRLALVFLLLLNISVRVRFCYIVSIVTKKAIVRNDTQSACGIYYTRYYVAALP